MGNLDKLKRPNPKTGEITPPKRIPPHGGSSTAPPKPKKEKPNKSAMPQAEQVLFQCGHYYSAGVFTGRKCPGCQSEADKKKMVKRKASYDKWISRSVDKYEDRGRLPDGAVFKVHYDAGAENWGGVLTIPGCPDFAGSHSGVFKLLRLLDEEYRKWLNEQAPKENPEAGVESGGAVG